MEEQLQKLHQRLQQLIESGALMPGEIISAIQALAMVDLVKGVERISDHLKSINEWCEVFADYMSKFPKRDD